MTLAPVIDDFLTVAVATPSDGPDVTRILKESYAQSPDFTVQSERFFTDNFNERSAVLTCRVRGELVGTMRAEVISDSADLNYEDEGFLLPNMAPALLLCRAATVSDQRARGVNSIMRAYCIEAAIELRLKSLVGEVYANAPRTRLMTELGYSFYPLKATSDADRTYQSECLFAYLDLHESGVSALKTLKMRNAELMYSALWNGPSIAGCLDQSVKQSLRRSLESTLEGR